MKYTELTPAEFNENITQRIADLMIGIAYANADFVCGECLNTLERLSSILGYLDDEVYTDTKSEVNSILERELL